MSYMTSWLSIILPLILWASAGALRAPLQHGACFCCDCCTRSSDCAAPLNGAPCRTQLSSVEWSGQCVEVSLVNESRKGDRSCSFMATPYEMLCFQIIVGTYLFTALVPHMSSPSSVCCRRAVRHSAHYCTVRVLSRQNAAHGPDLIVQHFTVAPHLQSETVSEKHYNNIMLCS